jgi:amino acid transporter
MINDVMSYSSKMLNLAFCLGGTIFYALLYKARSVARPLSLWGLVSAQGVFAGVVLGLLGASAPVFLYVAYIPFELVIAVWILIKGVKKEIAN